MPSDFPHPAVRITILDTTLRDGEQSPGATMRHDDKLSLARALEIAGVDVIEAGFPAASPGDFAAVRDIAMRSDTAIICGLARAVRADIDTCARAIAGAPRPRLHTFIGTSPRHRALTDVRAADLPGRVRESVAMARSLIEDVQWSAMDATRTEPDLLVACAEEAIAAGAHTINLPDTVGYATPDEMEALVRRVRTDTRGGADVTWAVHCHDDLGLATANTLAGLRGGATQLECTVNGLGERAGNAPLEEVVMALRTRRDRYGAEISLDTTRLSDLSARTVAASGQHIAAGKAVVGAHAFAHESGIHQDGMLKDRTSFEVMRPEDVGARTSLTIGKHSGRAAIADVLRRAGVVLSPDALRRLSADLKRQADAGGTLSHDLIVAEGLKRARAAA